MPQSFTFPSNEVLSQYSFFNTSSFLTPSHHEIFCIFLHQHHTSKASNRPLTLFAWSTIQSREGHISYKRLQKIFPQFIFMKAISTWSILDLVSLVVLPSTDISATIYEALKVLHNLLYALLYKLSSSQSVDTTATPAQHNNILYLCYDLPINQSFSQNYKYFVFYKSLLDTSTDIYPFLHFGNRSEDRPVPLCSVCT